MSVATPMRRGVLGPRSLGLHFLRHLVEMALAMMIGMVASAAVLLSIVGMTVDEGLRRHPVVFVVVQAFGMTLAMVAWMRVRGHSRRSCAEMAAAMVAPALPLICLRMADVISGSICGAYCALSLLAMVSLMLYRREEYAVE